jgi:urease accessory protein
MKTLTLIRGLRFVDSFFPSGGFAFSWGLEAAVQGGAVRNGADLAGYVEDLLRGSISLRESVALSRAHLAVETGKLSLAFKADEELDAMKIGYESRRGSRQMGRQVMRVAVEQMDEWSMLREFHSAIEDGRTPGHFPVCLGLTLAVCGWSREQTGAAYLYQTTLGFVSAAMKLLPIGQQEGQRLLDQWAPLCAALSRRALPKSGMVSWSPVQDIYTMRHHRLESRLFRS